MRTAHLLTVSRGQEVCPPLLPDAEPLDADPPQRQTPHPPLDSHPPPPDADLSPWIQSPPPMQTPPDPSHVTCDACREANPLPPCEQNDRTLVKILPCPKLRLGAVKIKSTADKNGDFNVGCALDVKCITI